MNVSDFTDLCSVQSHADSFTTGERSVFEVKDCPLSNDDAIWVAMMKNQHQIAIRRGVIWRVFHRAMQKDLRYREVIDAEKTAFLRMLRIGFKRCSNGIFWSSVVFALSAALLIPLLGFFAGSLIATAASICSALFNDVC